MCKAQHVGLGVFERRGHLGQPAVEVRDRFRELITSLVLRVGVEDRPDQRRQQTVLVLAAVPEALAQEVDGAALPTAAKDLRDRGLQAGVRITDGELDADHRPRLTRPRRKSVQNASVSASPTSIERISRQPVS